MTPDELRAAIKSRNLKFTRAAEVLGISRTHLWKILNYRVEITDDRAVVSRERLRRYDQGERLDGSSK